MQYVIYVSILGLLVAMEVETSNYSCLPLSILVSKCGEDFLQQVNKHSSFQDSRCFYVVLKDGRREDFSYRKCLDNWIRKKYPELAESFFGKYFRKPRNRAEQTATPRGDQTAMPPRDEAATPADQTSTPGPVETNE